MKKYMFAIAMVAVSATAVIGLSSFTTQVVSSAEKISEMKEELHTHVGSQGAHCNGTVGCSCSGFRAITDGKVWQQSYCKNCGHHKSNHR